MFRRHWSGLPKDPEFPPDLQSLGYFINEKDEVRLIEDPRYYFKFFLSRNERVNARQRMVFDHALEREIHARLEARGLSRLALPLGASPSERHVPIYASPHLATASRVVVVFGEPVKALGVLAGRIVSGPGGIDRGSMVSVVRALAAQKSTPTDPEPPAVVLANTGQLHWWPEERRAITVTDSLTVPLPSIVHRGRRHVRSLNSIPENEDPAQHVECVFRSVLGSMARRDAVIDVGAIGVSCELVMSFLDRAENWAAWGPRMNSMLLFAHVYPDDGLETPGLKEFLAKRTRAYVTSSLPLDTALAPPEGNPKQGIASLGCPCYSSAEPHHHELVLISALESALGYCEEVALTPGFENPPIEVVVTQEHEVQREFTEDDWAKVPEHERPWLSSGAGVLGAEASVWLDDGEGRVEEIDEKGDDDEKT